MNLFWKQITILLLFGCFFGLSSQESSKESMDLETITKELQVLKQGLEESKAEVKKSKDEANWIWTCIAAFLVFLCKLDLLMLKLDLLVQKTQ